MTEKLKGEAAQKAYRFWKLCIHSGLNVLIIAVEDRPVAMGFCHKKFRNVDFEIECADCKNYKMTRTPPKHERTAVRKIRIGTARRRSIAKSRDLFEIKQNRKRGTKKH